MMDLRDSIAESSEATFLTDRHPAGRAHTPRQRPVVKGWFRISIERLCRRHIVRDGAYRRLQRLLPVPLLAFVWFRAVHRKVPFDFDALLNASVTLRHLLLAVGLALLWNITLSRKPGGSLPTRKVLKAEMLGLTRSSIACGSVLFVGDALHSTWRQGATLGLALTGAFLLGSFFLLFAAFFLCTKLVASPVRARQAILVGSGPRASYLRSIFQSSHSGIHIIGCLDDVYVGSDPEDDNYLGALDALPNLLKMEPVELVLIGLPIKSQYEQIQNVIEVCETIGVESNYMLDVFATTRNVLQRSATASEVAVLGASTSDMRHWMKRGLDIAIAAPLLLLLSPVLLAIAAAIKWTSVGPVLFIQQRYGRNRHRFAMYKFRTMAVDAEERQSALEGMNEAQGPVFKLKFDPRVTKLGAFLRRTSLDELPQLINVLRGEMSLVGPRPLPLRDVSRFDKPWLLRRFSVLPGLTCLWQVRGRSNTMFDEWIRLDLEYIDKWSLALDFLILAQTIPAVLRRNGAM